MTVRIGETFVLARAVAEAEALRTAELPAAGPVPAESDVEEEPGTGEWIATTGAGFRIVPLWESGGFTGVYEAEWSAAQEECEGHLRALVGALEERWGPHRRVAMHVPLFRAQAGEPMPPVFRALCDQEAYGDLSVWGPLGEGAGGPRWVGVSLCQIDGDAPMVLVAVVTDEEIAQLPDR
ncbi:hypothetical protein AB0O07_32345 [Streptomyces sp. NPDC093085]|uniref:hypothetical protein n=1 Tax=Streptomyces sp. NPDC093085 TaxID=3155068 RepID=UPI00341ED2DC